MQFFMGGGGGGGGQGYKMKIDMERNSMPFNSRIRFQCFKNPPHIMCLYFWKGGGGGGQDIVNTNNNKIYSMNSYNVFIV